MTNAAQESFGTTPVTLEIEGHEYCIDPVRRGKIWAAIKHLRARWLQAYLDGTRGVPLPDGTRGMAIAEIATRTCEYIDVLNDLEAMAFFISLQITMDGKPLDVGFVMNVDGNGMSTAAYKALTSVLLNPEGTSDDPLENTTST